MAPATWGKGGITFAEGLHHWGRRAVTLLNYTLVFALKLRKSTENLSPCSRIATGLPVAQTWLSFEGPSDGLLDVRSPRLPVGTSVSPRSAQVPSKLPD
jgi:hypothetical protein